MVAAGTWFAPYFLNANTMSIGDFKGKRIIIVQLSGGNDGLNTIVPFENDLYYKARPQIGISKKDVIDLNGQLGMNPALKAIEPLFKEGLVSILNGVGYPNPERSHFRSMDIWHTASNADEYWKTGWLGRYLDAQCSNCDSLHQAVQLNGTLDLVMKGESLKGLAMTDPAQMINGANTSYQGKAMSSNSSHHDHEPVGYLYKTLVETSKSADYLEEKLQKNKMTVKGVPGDQFSKHLKTIVQMINAGLETSVYYTQLGGFDTHANQKNRQDRLLSSYANGIKFLVEELKKSGELKNTLIMTFSEFGRRVQQNASNGTDHGTANNLFVIGESVKGGFYNDMPSLSDLDNGDLKYTIDFRNVYATILQNWLEVDAQQILKRDFAILPFLKV